MNEDWIYKATGLLLFPNTVVSIKLFSTIQHFNGMSCKSLKCIVFVFLNANTVTEANSFNKRNIVLNFEQSKP